MRTAAFALLKLAVSISILGVVLSRIPLHEVLARAANGAPSYLACALGLVLASIVIVALRWRLLAKWLGVAIPAALAVRALFIGVFGAQVLPAALGTDVLRGWMVAQHTARTGAIVASVMADRLVGMFAVCLLFMLANPLAKQLPAPYGVLFGPAAVLATGVMLVAFVLGCRVRLKALPLLGALGLALAVHAAAVAIAALVARAYGVDDSLPLWLSIIPLSIIASAVPVSINGWGVREASIVALAAPMGVPAAEALVVSMTLGLLNMIASLPGAAVLLRAR